MVKKNNLNKKNKRKVCFIITSFIHYSRNFLILEELKKRSDVDLHIVIGGAALLSKYSAKYAHIRELLEKSGFSNLYEVYFNLEGNDTVTKAKTTGLGTIEFSSIYNQIKPDLVVVRGDRFEVLSAVTAASLMNIPVAHIEGGDKSGTLDESIRHSITKLSHIHFATNEPSKDRIIRMGEDEKYVFNFGSPDIEVVHKLSNRKDDIGLEKTGSGAHLSGDKNFLMVMYHPVSTEIKTLKKNTKNLLLAIQDIGIPTIWFWPNFDAGAEDISHELRTFNDEVKDHKIRFMKYIPPEQFLALLGSTQCLIGNSSAGIKECSYLGVPVVNVGTRQKGRLAGENVVNVSSDKDSIKIGIKKQLKVGKYPVSHIYMANDTSKEISEKLASVELYVQKSFKD